jgi:transketolase
MRDTFVKTLFEIAKLDPRIMLITGDLGFGVFEEFSQKLPQQFINAGVAEQNMTLLACGLASEGFIPLPTMMQT